MDVCVCVFLSFSLYEFPLKLEAYGPNRRALCEKINGIINVENQKAFKWMAFLNDDIKINVKCSKLCDSIAADAVARLFCFSQNEVIRRCYLFGIDCCVLYGCELVQWNWMDRIINKQDFSPCAFVPNSTINYRIQGEMESFSPGMYLNWMYEWMWMRIRASIWQPFSKSARDLLQIKTQQINAFSFEWRSLRKCMLKHVRNWRRDSSHRVTRCECRFVLFFSLIFVNL